MNILGLNIISFLCSLDISSVIEVFKYKHVRDVIVFHCFKENQLILPQRVFHFNNFRTVFVFMPNNISWELPYSYPKIGVLINTSCDGWEKFQEFQNSHTYDLIRTNTWGYAHDGRIDGMVGSLQRHEADVGGSPIFFKTDRTYVIDYVAETWPSKQSFIFRHPKHPTGVHTVYSRPLSNSVWYCVIAFLFVTASTVFFMLKFNIDEIERGETSQSLAFLFAWSAICQQGMSLRRNSLALKVVVFVTFVCSITLYQYYNATVVSTLLKESPITIRTLKDLLQSDLKVGVEDVAYVKDYFAHTKDPIAITMYEKKIVTGNNRNFFDPEYGMSLVKKGGYAFHVDTAYSYGIMKKTFTEREICEIRDVTMYPPQKMAAVLKKNSPYRNYFAIGIRRLWETGLMQRMKHIWDEPKPPCVRTQDSSIFSVSILEFSTPLFIVVFGVIASVVVLLCETLFDTLFNMR
ncbi:ionotropic receptor 75a-like [Bombyx mandarina]|uniref:Ionotropic receptor 75a-like n=1 Tax=Bombyx mandarina TaxID=7092 RepID=A0A6J2K844_BOMMA|nr:ionotropic receptor 75a-like [Bombyx mandarina]